MALEGPADQGSSGAPAEPLDLLFQRNATRYGDRLALVDDPDRPAWNGSPALRLTYAEAERRVATLAAFLSRTGLRPDAVIALAAPNAVETVLLLLAASRAELIVALVPPLWRRRDILRHLSPLRPEALVATGTIDGEPAASRWRAVSGEIGSIRHHFGFGVGLPAEFRDLGGIDLADPAVTETGRPADPAGRIATITMNSAGEGGEPQFHARSHGQWQAVGIAIEAAAGLPPNPTWLLPFNLSGLTGIGAGLVSWLRSGGTLHLHHFRSLSGLVRHTAEVAPHCLIAPGPIVPSLLANLARRHAAPPPSVFAVWKDGFPTKGGSAPSDVRLLDLTVVDDLACFVALRLEDLPAPLPLGVPRTGGPSAAETRLEGRSQKAGDRLRPLVGGTLSVRGPMVPHAGRLPLPALASVDSGLIALVGGFIRTGTQCRLVDGPALMPDGRSDGLLSVGGQPVSTSDLDELYGAPADVISAAAFGYRGAAGGAKIGAAIVSRAGAAIGTSSFRRALMLAGAALHHLPETVFSLPSLPRRADGSIDRQKIAAMVRAGEAGGAAQTRSLPGREYLDGLPPQAAVPI